MAEEQIKTPKKGAQPPSRKSYHHGDLREALVKSTQALIEEKGIDHFSVADACRAAGVSTAAPYKHFKNKEEMVMASVCDALARHRDTMRDDLAKFEKGSPERIVAMGRNYLDNAASEPGMFRLRFAQFDGDAPEDIKSSGDEIYGMVQEEVRAALGEPEINAKVKERAYLLWAIVHGMSYLAMVPEFAEKRPEGTNEALLARIGSLVMRD